MTSDDRFLIFELLNRYLLAVDSHEPDPWVALFTDDGSFQNGDETAAKGHKNLLGFIRAWHAAGRTASIHHFMSTWSVNVSGDEAVAKSYYFAADVVTAPKIVATGRFEDRLRKEQGVWRFVSRHHTLDPSFRPAGGA